MLYFNRKKVILFGLLVLLFKTYHYVKYFHINENYLGQESIVYKIPSNNVSSSNEISHTSQSPTPSKPSTSTLPLVTNEVSTKVDQYSGNSITIAVNPNETPKKDDQNKTQQEIEDEMQPHLGARFSNGTLGYMTNPKLRIQRTKQEMKALFHRQHIVPPIHLEYINVSKDPSHYAALDAHGNAGYVHNPTYLTQNPPSLFGNIIRPEGYKNDSNSIMLMKKVQVRSREKEEEKSLGSGSQKQLRLFCAVYTMERYHSKIDSILETWGSKCDGFMAASTKTNQTLSTVNIPHEGPEVYGNIWQKTRANWAYIYDNYYNDYDWFHFGGDDMYVIVENLRYYLESDEIQFAVKGGSRKHGIPEGSEIPLFLGRRFALKGNMNHLFNSGGSGYTLNKAALKLLVAVAFPECSVDRKTSEEDVMVAECFREYGVYPYETKDEFGGERYMPFSPGTHYEYKPNERGWYNQYSIGKIKEGLDHCSKDSIAFHYIGPELMRRMHAILYNNCTLNE